MENKKISIKDNEVLNREMQKEVDRVADKYENCNEEFEQVGEEPRGNLLHKDIESETRIQDEEIVNILAKM